jgi:hypothetical protein
MEIAVPMLWIVASITLSCCLSTGAEARPARCFTTVDGYYGCQFVATDQHGSFRISAPGKRTIRLNIERPGVAFGFADFGTRNVPLPGQYRRTDTDPGCWVNEVTQTLVCAW